MSLGARRRKGRFCRYKPPSTMPGGLARSEQRGGPRALWQVSHITTAIRFAFVLSPFSFWLYDCSYTRIEPARGFAFPQTHFCSSLPLLSCPFRFFYLSSPRRRL